MNEQRRRLCLFDITQWRPLPKLIVIVPGKAAKLCVDQVLVKRSRIEADQVTDAGGGHRGFEARRLRDDPARHKTTVAAASHTHSIWIDPGVTVECFINTGHYVAVIAAAPFVERAVGKFLAIAGRSTRIEIEHGVTARRVYLERGIEGIAKHPMRPAVDTEDHRILAIFAPAERFHQPGLNRRALDALKR